MSKAQSQSEIGVADLRCQMLIEVHTQAKYRPTRDANWKTTLFQSNLLLGLSFNQNSCWAPFSGY